MNLPPATTLPVALHPLQAWQAAEALARRDILAVDLLRACLDRIQAREPQVQAFVSLNADAAMRLARELDAGPVRGLLHGLPLGVKDLLDTAGIPTTWGAEPFRNRIPAADAAVVARLEFAVTP